MEIMPRVLLFSTTTGYQTRAFGEAADALGVDLVLATDRCDRLDDPWQDQAIPIRLYDESGSVAAVLESARTRPLTGLLVVGDRPTVIAARVAESLGLPGHPPAAAAVARNKQLTRERLRDGGLLVPWFATTPADADPAALARHTPFPCVIKPLALSGSRGVIRADDSASFLAAFDRLRALLRAPEVRAERDAAHDTVLVEGFIEGREFAVEGIVTGGRLQVFALFDKPDPLDGPYFEETIYVTPSREPDEVRATIVRAAQQAVEALGLERGPVHAEMRVNGCGVWMLEVAPRPGRGRVGGASRWTGHRRHDGAHSQGRRVPGSPRDRTGSRRGGHRGSHHHRQGRPATGPAARRVKLPGLSLRAGSFTRHG
jgi:biotin carboxylase